ncbi:uncharacterized protein LOC144628101 isoform X1 [Oculina patagonica]
MSRSLRKMTQNSIREFVRENFGKDYFPVYHGQTNIVTPLALIVKRKRKWWKRPFGKAEMIILGGLEKYIVDEKKKHFHNDSASKLQKEMKRLQKTETGEVSRNLDIAVQGLDQGELELKFSDVLGDLELGKLTEEYYLDPDLREILSDTVLDPSKMAHLEGHHLLLVTSVVYSAKFVLKGNRMHQVTLSGNIHAPPEAAALIGKHPLFNGHIAKKTVPPPMVERKSRAPFLFKFCRVVYDKEHKRLHIQDGEFVGRPVRSHRGLRSDMSISDEEAALYLEMEECLTQDGSTLLVEDYGKVEDVKKLLITEEAGTRKSLVLMYLSWFEQILTSEKRQFLIERPLTISDCEFLRKLGIPARPKQLMLRVATAQKDVIQEYGILFKLLNEISEDKWEEILRNIFHSKQSRK